MGIEALIKVEEAPRITQRIDPRRNTCKHILIKLTKINYKEKILKVARNSHIELTKELLKG